MNFDNGETKKVDLKETIFNDQCEIFKPLRDIYFFKKNNSIKWANELDLAPEFLYELVCQQSQKSASIIHQFRYKEEHPLRVVFLIIEESRPFHLLSFLNFFKKFSTVFLTFPFRNGVHPSK